MSRKFVLSVDAGGIRCMIPVLVLIELERRLRQAGRADGLHHSFDMVAGAGIGALVVAGLACRDPRDPARPVSTPTEILRLFKSENRFIFEKPPVEGPGQGPYATGMLETVLKMRFGADAVLSDAMTHMLFPAYDILKRAPMMFSTIEPATASFYIWQALRAACADPGYFAPAMVENRSQAKARGTPLLPLIGAGHLGRDPALSAYVEAARLGWTAPGDDLVILSLGTGVDRRPLPYIDADSVGSHGPSLAAITPPLVDQTTEFDCPIPYQLNALINGDGRAFNGTATRVTPQNRDGLCYFRVNGALQAASAGIDDVTPENLRALQEDAARIIVENGALLDQLVERLLERPAARWQAGSRAARTTAQVAALAPARVACATALTEQRRHF